MSAESLDFLPLWVFFLICCVVVLAPLEFGKILGNRYRARNTSEDGPSIGVIVGSILGLVAFLLAFTFNLSASVFLERRHVVLEEANSIGTTYLRTQLLPESDQVESRQLLREYVDVRIAATDRDRNVDQLESSVQRSEEILARLWQLSIDASTVQPTVLTGLYIQSLNETIDLHSKRLLVGVRARIPLTIWLGLFATMVVGMLSTGFHSGLTTMRRNLVTWGLMVTLASVLTLIADLDRSGEGTLRTTQAPMIDLQESMKSNPLPP